MPSTVISPRPVWRAAARVARALATPLVPADYLDLVDPLRSGSALRARVVEVRPETADAVTLVLQPGRGWRGHRAGQWVRLGVDVDGVRHWRPYSLTSPPRPDGLLTLAVKAIPDGRVSTHLVRRLRPGALLHLDQAAGDFVLSAPLPGRVLFLTAGSGVTPAIGMLREAHEELRDVVVLHSDRTADDVIHGAELRRLAAGGRIRLLERHTDRDGLLAPDELDVLVPDWRDRETWACGPQGLLDALDAHWMAQGDPARLHVEQFRPNLAAVGDGGTVTFAQSGVSAEVDGATPLLEAGESAGLLMPFGCRMGICFGCVLPLTEGAVRDLRNGDVTSAADGERVMVQTCVSAAAGACRVDH